MDDRSPLSSAAVETVRLVELSELLNLARLGYEMRRAQKRYFKARWAQPHARPVEDLRAAQAAEAEFDRAVTAALDRERTCLPGMGGEP